MRLAVGILSLLVLSCISEGAVLRQGISERASFCKGVFGVDACVYADIIDGNIHLKFTVAGKTVVDKVIDPRNQEYCTSALGVSVCLQVNLNGNDLCFGVKGSLPFIGSTSFSLGCFNVDSVIGK